MNDIPIKQIAVTAGNEAPDTIYALTEGGKLFYWWKNIWTHIPMTTENIKIEKETQNNIEAEIETKRKGMSRISCEKYADIWNNIILRKADNLK